MLKITSDTIVKVAADHGWLHGSGRLAGTLNASQMALGLGVSVSTVTRAYESGDFGMVFLERLHAASRTPFDELITVVDDDRSRAVA